MFQTTNQYEESVKTWWLRYETHMFQGILDGIKDLTHEHLWNNVWFALETWKTFVVEWI